MTKQVVTRFAPSPTGFLHIGGARTALFNWLYAKANNGKMLLRIEDTDRERSTDDAIEAIFESMKWLGLNWDDEVVYQFSGASRHQEVAEQLISEDKAYRCYCSSEKVQAMREKARAEGGLIGYDGTCRNLSPEDAPKDQPSVVRFKSPLDGETVVEDQVQGRVAVRNDQIDDLILLRSDGTPTYMLSVVVDDHDMGITHIIRGDDHLTNAIKQTQIYQALKWDIPVFAHIPLIMGPDGKKLSKRHGATGAEVYRSMGYLPAAMQNYLARLGWSHGDHEIFSTEQAINWFNLESIGKSPARFDFAKLENLNAHYIKQTDNAELIALIKDIWDDCGIEDLPAADTVSDEKWSMFEAALPALKERAKTLLDLINGANFIFAERPLSFDKKAQKALSDEGKGHLSALLPLLENSPEWTLEGVETLIKDYVASAEVGFGKVAMPVRAALTGTTQAPGVYDLLIILGKTEAINRIKEQAN
ncbi:MAG: glutamate--tRNA ligase [Methyloligellaceae bacterium]